MTNQILLIGRLKEISNTELVVEVRESVNSNDTVILTVVVGENIMKHVKDLCHIDDLVGIKAFFKNELGRVVIYADKITFLSSKNNNEGGE